MSTDIRDGTLTGLKIKVFEYGLRRAEVLDRIAALKVEMGVREESWQASVSLFNRRFQEVNTLITVINVIFKVLGIPELEIGSIDIAMLSSKVSAITADLNIIANKGTEFVNTTPDVVTAAFREAEINITGEFLMASSQYAILADVHFQNRAEVTAIVSALSVANAVYDILLNVDKQLGTKVQEVTTEIYTVIADIREVLNAISILTMMIRTIAVPLSGGASPVGETFSALTGAVMGLTTKIASSMEAITDIFDAVVGKTTDLKEPAERIKSEIRWLWTHSMGDY